MQKRSARVTKDLLCLSTTQSNRFFWRSAVRFNALLVVPQRYREASDIIKKGKLCSLFINDLDAGTARGPYHPCRSLRRDLCMGLHYRRQL